MPLKSILPCHLCKELKPRAAFNAVDDPSRPNTVERFCRVCQDRTRRHREDLNAITPPNPSGLCMCGCGATTPLAKKTSIRRQHIAGQPIRFVPTHSLVKDHLYIIDPITECWNWNLGVSTRGYGVIHRDGRQHLAHRWIFAQHNGPIPEEHEIHHTCRNTRCVNPEHLQALPPLAHKRTAPQRKVTPEMVREIRNLNGVIFRRQIAERFGISQSLVTNIINGKRWSDVS